MVQACHACQEAGARFGCPSETHLVVVSVPNEQSLLEIAGNMRGHGIDHTLFFEPDYDTGHTAVCTEPDVHRRARRFTKGLPMLKFAS